MIKPRGGLLDIAAYKPGRPAPAGNGAQPCGYKLSANESPFGASPKAREAYQSCAADLHVYPEAGSPHLRAALSDHCGLELERLICGAGSDELISLLTRAYSGPGDAVVKSEYGFVMYDISAMSCGAEVRRAPEADHLADPDAIAGLADERAKLVFLANPNNPTGARLPFSEVCRLRDLLPPHVLFVLDEAYAEFLPVAEQGESLEWARAREDVVVLRTFSKAYGLAALRVGWGYCPASVRDVLDRIRAPFNVTRPAEFAAIAALKDQTFLRQAVADTIRLREQLAADLRGLGLDVRDSMANFLLVKTPHEWGGSEVALQALQNLGVVARAVNEYGLSEYVRVTVGLDDANRAVHDGFRAFRERAGS